MGLLEVASSPQGPRLLAFDSNVSSYTLRLFDAITGRLNSTAGGSVVGGRAQHFRLLISGDQTTASVLYDEEICLCRLGPWCIISRLRCDDALSNAIAATSAERLPLPFVFQTSVAAIVGSHMNIGLQTVMGEQPCKTWMLQRNPTLHSEAYLRVVVLDDINPNWLGFGGSFSADGAWIAAYNYEESTIGALRLNSVGDSPSLLVFDASCDSFQFAGTSGNYIMHTLDHFTYLVYVPTGSPVFTLDSSGMLVGEVNQALLKDCFGFSLENVRGTSAKVLELHNPGGLS